MFTSEDLKQIELRGSDVEVVKHQIEGFCRGFAPLSVVRAAAVGDGIRVLSDTEIDSAMEYYAERQSTLNAVKFVPASGAATRMFKELFEYVNDDKASAGVDKVLNSLPKFAFWGELSKILPEGASSKEIISAIIGEGLNYGTKPKGLITFHKYDNSTCTPLEEHLKEGAQYAASSGGVNIHFTISEEHREGFVELVDAVVKGYEDQFGVSYNIEYSTQIPATDTIAVNPDNSPFRQEDGSLLFRPAGHGALIENLNGIDADIIFIKTIDNVTTDARRSTTTLYKRALAGLTLQLQCKVAEHIKALQQGADPKPTADFMESELSIELPENWDAELLLSLLDRPVRLCGMVRNEGEPGGGPFWVKNADGSSSLQIAEQSQIGDADSHLIPSSTHFNPVDLVCGVRRYDGSKYDLRHYVDPTTGFVSEKSFGGRPLKAQELPGLWNGAMARWNTIFVDVPITTFSPVKVVQDLLREQHQ